MSRTSTVLISIGLSTLSLGCVASEKYDALKMQRDSLLQRVSQLQTDNADARSAAEAYRAQLESVGNRGSSENALMANVQQQNASLQAQLDELNRRYAEAVGQIGTGPMLPAELNNELLAFAAANPDLIEYDEGRGMVKFKSDLTFDSGDATLKPDAKSAIDRFASILNSPAASSYELLVAGHTDSQPVSNSVTVQKGHKDNWYLSSHRAISVAKALSGNSVNTRRMGWIGYADFRPIASNADKSGMAKNRRVEVLILPTHTTSQAKPDAPAAGASGNQATVDTDSNFK